MLWTEVPRDQGRYLLGNAARMALRRELMANKVDVSMTCY